MNPASKPEGALSPARLIAYAAPTMALQTMVVPLLLYLPPAYSSIEIGMAPAIVGLMFTLGRAFEAITDPLIGALSDRTRSRFGPRRPWIMLGTPLAVVAAWFLLTPAPGAPPWYLAVSLMLFYLVWTAVYIPHQSWGGELAGDYHERTRIAGFRETGAFIGYLLASLTPLIYWQFIVGLEAPTFLQTVQSIGVLFAIMLPLAVVWCLAVVPNAARASTEQHVSWRELFALLGRNRPFLRLASAYLFDRLAMGIYFAAQPLLIAVALDLQKYFLWIALGNTLVAALFAPLWIGIARRLGKHRTYVVANLVTMSSYALLFVAEPGQLGLVVACNVLMGFGNGGTMITPSAMAADTADYDEMRSGVQQMAGHMALLAFVFKTGMALGVGIGLGLIGMFGFEGQGSVPSETALLGIRLCASWLPILLLVPPILMMWQFPIDARRQNIIRRWLDRRRAPVAAGIL